jgi:hypothetical protein
LDLFWNETSGIEALSYLQDPNGSFGNDLYGTTDALLAVTTLLNGAGVLNLKAHRCTAYTYHPLEPLQSLVTEEVRKESTTNPTLPTTTEAGPGSSETAKGPSPSLLPLTETSTGLGGEGKEVETTSRGGDGTLSVKYFLWIGPEPPTAEKHNLTIQVAPNTTFFRIMQRAAELDSAYE